MLMIYSRFLIERPPVAEIDGSYAARRHSAYDKIKQAVCCLCRASHLNNVDAADLEATILLLEDMPVEGRRNLNLSIVELYHRPILIALKYSQIPVSITALLIGTLWLSHIVYFF